MPEYYPGSTRTMCPFYIKEAEMTITCQSINPSARGTAQKFTSRAEKEKWQREHCYKYKCNCGIADLLQKKEERNKNGTDNNGDHNVGLQ